MSESNPVSPAARAAAVTRLRRRLGASGAEGVVTVSVNMLNNVVAAYDDAKRACTEAVNQRWADRELLSADRARLHGVLEQLLARIQKSVAAAEPKLPADQFWAMEILGLGAFAEKVLATAKAVAPVPGLGACAICSCTEDNPCEGGCAQVTDGSLEIDLCTACAWAIARDAVAAGLYVPGHVASSAIAPATASEDDECDYCSCCRRSRCHRGLDSGCQTNSLGESICPCTEA